MPIRKNYFLAPELCYLLKNKAALLIQIGSTCSAIQNEGGIVIVELLD